MSVWVYWNDGLLLLQIDSCLSSAWGLCVLLKVCFYAGGWETFSPVVVVFSLEIFVWNRQSVTCLSHLTVYFSYSEINFYFFVVLVLLKIEFFFFLLILLF